jgi:hypothetical protein
MWNIYIEFEGNPIYADIELDDEEYQTEDEVYDYVIQSLVIEPTKEA